MLAKIAIALLHLLRDKEVQNIIFSGVELLAKRTTNTTIDDRVVAGVKSMVQL